MHQMACKHMHPLLRGGADCGCLCVFLFFWAGKGYAGTGPCTGKPQLALHMVLREQEHFLRATSCKDNPPLAKCCLSWGVHVCACICLCVSEFTSRLDIHLLGLATMDDPQPHLVNGAQHILPSASDNGLHSDRSAVQLVPSPC
jgi:hypothetical protein